MMSMCTSNETNVSGIAVICSIIVYSNKTASKSVTIEKRNHTK